MVLVKDLTLKLKTLEGGLYELDLRQYSSPDGEGEGTGFEVYYTSPILPEDLSTQLVNKLSSWDVNICKSLIDTLYIHSGDLNLNYD